MWRIDCRRTREDDNWYFLKALAEVCEEDIGGEDVTSRGTTNTKTRRPEASIGDMT